MELTKLFEDINLKDVGFNHGDWTLHWKPK